MRVIWTATALRGLLSAYDYLSEFNPNAAAEVARSLREAGDGLEKFPYRGRPVPGTSMREAMTACPYIIWYRVAGDSVFILRIRHAARRPTTP